jgi:hypothetical protein
MAHATFTERTLLASALDLAAKNLPKTARLHFSTGDISPETLAEEIRGDKPRGDLFFDAFDQARQARGQSFFDAVQEVAATRTQEHKPVPPPSPSSPGI